MYRRPPWLSWYYGRCVGLQYLVLCVLYQCVFCSYEGTGPFSFLRTRQTAEQFKWSANDYLAWAKRNLGDNSGLIVSDAKAEVFTLRYDDDDHPMLPLEPVEDNMTRFRNLFAQYLRVMYGMFFTGQYHSLAS